MARFEGVNTYSYSQYGRCHVLLELTFRRIKVLLALTMKRPPTKKNAPAECQGVL